MSHAVEDQPLSGRVALVTGVSRRIGIAAAIADRLTDVGAGVYATGWSAHDMEMPWGADEAGVQTDERDLADPSEPGALVDDVITRFGRLDIVVAVHARSSYHDLHATTAEELDRCWAVNVRSVVLLAKRFAEVQSGGGRMIWFTSGQHLEPMPAEMPYAITKGALEAMTPTLAAALAEFGIVANCINPGPVDTGWADADARGAIAARFPSGRWGVPDDVANLIEFLVSDNGSWIQGQVINSEGGFRR